MFARRIVTGNGTRCDGGMMFARRIITWFDRGNGTRCDGG
jgi:hypothetical protein